MHDGMKVGDLTNIIWSYRLKANIGFGLLSVEVKAGDTVTVALATGLTSAKLVELPFL